MSSLCDSQFAQLSIPYLWIWCDDFILQGTLDYVFFGIPFLNLRNLFYVIFAAHDIGKMRINTLKKSDAKRFYNRLADDRGLKASTIDSVHTVLHQVLDMAVDDDYI